MKIGIFEIESFSAGKENIIDERLETIKQMEHSAKKVYIQAEVINDSERLSQSDGIIVEKNKKLDLILKDLDFTEKRISNTQEENETNLLNRFKEQLEKESFIFELTLSDEERSICSGYSLLTRKPVFLVDTGELENKYAALAAAYTFFDYITFFTGGEKEARAWSIKKGMNSWQAAGIIHSDIQKGFIRAEVIGFNDLIKDGGRNQARANNHLRLEGKEYIVQDGDLINFRFNK
ncbi:DUF933 domain-containing protein [Candidatus Omnitrophota bacterium]